MTVIKQDIFDKVNAMGKVELRAACKVAGITYGKLNNEGMRDALVQHANSQKPLPSLLDLAADEAAKPGVSRVVVLQTNIGEPTAIEKGATAELATRKPPKKAPKERKVRAAANGVTMPGAGTICHDIWTALDAKRTELKSETPTFEHLRELAKAYGWQKNTAMTQYQRWKQYHGLMPRTQTV